MGIDEGVVGESGNRSGSGIMGGFFMGLERRVLEREAWVLGEGWGVLMRELEGKALV